ncbi:hypothetical protein WME99_30345 [Sorangium sp. So ce136]|uniref:hypothetical protein n=2 Tax=unclassified Sorangium TaxID=2621164 RepID=UPI003EFD77A2
MARDDDAIDADMLLRMAFEQAARHRPDGSSVLSDFEDSVAAMLWVHALAVPRLFLGMSRMPSREHLLRMVDWYLAYVRRGDRHVPPEFSPVPYEEREPLAMRLRVLVEAWSPPELPPEITEVARAILHAEGKMAPPGGWDDTPEPEMPAEELLYWPEGVPALLKSKRQGTGDRERGDS